MTLVARGYDFAGFNDLRTSAFRAASEIDQRYGHCLTPGGPVMVSNTVSASTWRGHITLAAASHRPRLSKDVHQHITLFNFGTGHQTGHQPYNVLKLLLFSHY
jgi:hypothetical protein